MKDLDYDNLPTSKEEFLKFVMSTDISSLSIAETEPEHYTLIDRWIYDNLDWMEIELIRHKMNFWYGDILQIKIMGIFTWEYQQEDVLYNDFVNKLHEYNIL